MKNILLTLALAAFYLSSSAQTDVTFTVNHKLGSETFAMNMAAKNNMGHDFNVTRLQYYISEITLTHDGGSQTAVEDMWILVDASAATEVALGNFAITELEGITYKIGVDADHNHTDPASYPTNHALAPVNPSMHWGWASGYRFIALEGNGGPNLNQTIELHGLGDDNYFEVNHPMNKFAVNNKINVAVDADYTKLLEDILLINGVIVHGINRQGKQILENARDYTFTLASGNSGLAELDDVNAFEVFPNPTTNQTISIHLDVESTGDYSVRIRDILGRTVGLENAIFHNTSQEVQLPSKGIYLLELVRDGQLLMTRKVLSK